jgi:excisionase family DNA binding protein
MQQQIMQKGDTIVEKTYYMKVSEFAKQCRVNTWTVYRWIRLGVINAVRLPTGTVRIPSSEVDRVLNKEE